MHRENKMKLDLKKHDARKGKGLTWLRIETIAMLLLKR